LLKKSYIFLFILIATLSYSWTYALSESQKWVILDNFKEKQYDLLFESNLWDITSDFTDIFNATRKMNIYEKRANEAKNQREEAQEKSNILQKNITSLQDSIKQLDEDISNTMIRVNRINEKVIDTKDKIDTNEKTIEVLKKKVKDNNEVLLEYLSYIYKKTNTIYNDSEVDNLKAILLNGDDIWGIINDIYFKWLIQVTWKNLIDKHKEYINDLYVEEVNLKKQELNLKQLRKMWIVEKKVLDDKKAFKERILEISKWKQSLYEKFVADKLAVEKNLQMQSFKEKIKFNSVRDELLNKYGCDYVDLSKETNQEVDYLTPECLDVNKLIYSESLLRDTWTWSYNFFDWPVTPTRWISSFFHDPEYYKDFGSEHEAIDIRQEQWTPIKAPADWYVVFVQPPESQDYAYVALKHFDWYLTVYGHISDVFVKKYDFVKKWEIFAQTWWEYGTFWAWYLSTWPHLHFEVFRDKEYIDPLTVLDLSYLRYMDIPDKYKFKYYSDFKARNWYEYKDIDQNTVKFKLLWNTEIERQKYLIDNYAYWSFKNWQMWIDESLYWNLDPSFVMCVWLAETSLWRKTKTAFNIWNVWNTDSWSTITFPNARAWLYAMVKAFNNKYLSQYDKLMFLSRYWNKDENKPIYASSPDNWHNNIVKCLSHLKWEYVPDDYNFRISN